jgi:hypothetical protein
LIPLYFNERPGSTSAFSFWVIDLRTKSKRPGPLFEAGPFCEPELF